MHIVSVAVASPGFEPWVQQSFPVWFASMAAGLRADLRDPTTEVEAEVLAGLRVAEPAVQHHAAHRDGQRHPAGRGEDGRTWSS